jgi:hypothetical protein
LVWFGLFISAFVLIDQPNFEHGTNRTNRSKS